jgi:tetraacyldisaccharide-1-P 4'-kinase
MDIVIIDPSQHLASNRVFPRGTLREPLSGLRRSHVVVINGMPGEGSADAVEVEIRSVHGQADIFYCSQTIQSLVSFPSWYEAGEFGTPTEAASSAYLATALGNPERFRRDVQRLGIDVRGVKIFPDHCRLRHKDWLDCANEARSKGADTIITTEKDAVKMSHAPDFPLLVAVQSTRISDSEAFQKILEGCVEERQ